MENGNTIETPAATTPTDTPAAETTPASIGTPSKPNKSKLTIILAILFGILLVATIVSAIILINSDNSMTADGPDTSQTQTPNDDEDEEYIATDLASAIADLPAAAAKEFIFETLAGRWNATDGIFVDFTDSTSFAYGLDASSFGVIGNITDIVATGDYTFEFTLDIPAVPANEMSDATPARTETVFVDVKGLGIKSTISISLESLGNNEPHTFNRAQ